MTPPDGGDAPEATVQPVSSNAPENGGQRPERTLTEGGFPQDAGSGEKQRQGGRGESAPEATEAADDTDTADTDAARRDTP